MKDFALQLVVVASGLLLVSCSSPPAPRGDAPMVGWTGPGSDLCVNVSLGDGTKLLCNLDTGCGQTVFDRSLETHLGKRTGTIRHNWIFRDAVEANVFAAPELYLNGTRLKTGSRIVTDDLKTLFGDRPVPCVLGIDCLKHYCIQLDFAEQQVRLLDPDHLPSKDLGQAFPLSFVNPHFLARLLTFFNGSGAMALAETGFLQTPGDRFWLDTGLSGNGDLMVNPELFNRAIRHQPANWTIVVTNTPVMSRVAGFPFLPFKGGTNSQVIIGELSKPSGEFQGWLGSRFLSRYLATLNFPRRTLYLKQRTDWVAPETSSATSNSK